VKKESRGDFSLVFDQGDNDIYIISKNLKNKWINYFWQSAAAGIVTFILLYIFLSGLT
jgi:hypothetical protein